MARPLRLEYAGVLYYVTSRAHQWEGMYGDDEDREACLAVLSQVCERAQRGAVGLASDDEPLPLIGGDSTDLDESIRRLGLRVLKSPYPIPL
jgi:hypothetical protein